LSWNYAVDGGVEGEGRGDDKDNQVKEDRKRTAEEEDDDDNDTGSVIPATARD